MNKNLWNQIIAFGRDKEPKSVSQQNQLDKDDVTTILASMEFHQATDIWMKQTYYDLLGPPKFRVFDWLAMCVMSRNDDNRKQNEMALKVLVHSYVKSEGDVKKFIEDLRITDYQIDTSWEKVDVEEVSK